MIYIKKKVNNTDVDICLDENSVFYTNCGECGKLVEATDDILEDFTGYLFGSTYICCEECTAKRKGIISNENRRVREMVSG